MSSKAKKSDREWIVEYTGTAKMHVLVVGKDEDEARAKFDAGDWASDPNEDSFDITGIDSVEENV